MYVLVQYPDHWLVIISGVGGLPSILGAKARTNAALAVCSRLHDAMTESQAVTRHGWLTVEEYESPARAGDAFWSSE